MKKYFFWFVLFGQITIAQPNLWRLEINYPLLIDQNFVGQNFNGIAEFGINYHFHEDLHYRFGFSLHNSLFKDRAEIMDINTDFNVMLWLVQPRINVDFMFDSFTNVHPYVGVGYSFVTSFTNGNVAQFFPEGGSTRTGINVIAGLTFDISWHWYANAAYDFVRLSKIGTIANPFLQNINMIKLCFMLKETTELKINIKR